jgi:signal transduction histidine kinase
MTELALAHVLSNLRRGVNFDVLSDIRFDGDTGQLGFLTADERSETAHSVVVNPSDRRDFSLLGGMDEAVIEIRAVEGDRPLHLRLIVERNRSGCAWERGIAIWLSDDDPALAGVADRQRLAHIAVQSAVVAHELRQPLSTIAMAAKSIELIVEQLGQSAIETAKFEDIARAAGRIRVQVERARAIMTDALHTGATHIAESHQADVAEAISSAAASLQALCDDHAITLVADIPDHPLRVALPALAVEQVIVNAVHNAVDSVRTARSQGQPAGAVTLRAGTEHGLIVCQVIDDGLGLAEGTAPDLFQPFFTTKAAVDGVGLGLHISRRIVERAGGTIDLTSNPGRGATLSFSLPTKGLSST